MTARKINARDDQGRPTDVTWAGDPGSQCPGCLSDDVEPLTAVGMVPVDATLEAEPVAVRRMRCRNCRARWWKAGV